MERSLRMPKLYSVPKEVIAENLDGKAVVLHLTTGKYFALNASGTLMWELLAADGDSSRAAVEISARYGVEPATAERDLSGFIAELLSLGLLIEKE